MNADPLLSLLVAELKTLLAEGHTYTPDQGQPRHYSVVLRCFVCDIPAFATIKKTKGHAGYSPCHKCTVYGHTPENVEITDNKKKPLVYIPRVHNEMALKKRHHLAFDRAFRPITQQQSGSEADSSTFDAEAEVEFQSQSGSKKKLNYPAVDVKLRTDASFRTHEDPEHHTAVSLLEGDRSYILPIYLPISKITYACINYIIALFPRRITGVRHNNTYEYIYT